MKLPGKDDPHGDKEGSLPLDAVLDALRENGVAVHPLGNGLYLLAVGDEVESQRFGNQVGGLMIRRLAERFAIPTIHFYYNPSGSRRGRQ